MKASVFTYMALATVALITAATACVRTHRSEIDCTKEQIGRLFTADVVHLQADTTAAVSIDASGIMDAAFDFSDIVRDLRFIPLETTKDSRLGSVRRLIFTDGYILASDANGVKVFDSNGKYVNGIPYGALSTKNDFSLDRSSDEILVYTQGSIGHYDMQCNRRWVESIPLSFSAMNTTHSGDKLVMFFGPDDENPVLGDLEGAPFLVMDRQGAIVARPDVPVRSNAPPREGPALQQAGSDVALSKSCCDTIFALTDSSFCAKYILHYPRPQSLIPELRKVDNFFAGNALMTDRGGLFFKLQSDRANTVFAFYDDSTHHLVGGRPEFDYRIIPPIYNPIATCGSYYAALFNTYLTDEDNGRFTFLGDIVPDTSKAALRGIRHDDNPVVVLYRVEF